MSYYLLFRCEVESPISFTISAVVARLCLFFLRPDLSGPEGYLLKDPPMSKLVNGLVFKSSIKCTINELLYLLPLTSIYSNDYGLEISETLIETQS